MARTKKDNQLKSLPKDLILPSAADIEASVLGAMLIEKEAVPKAIELLNPDAFYSPKHRIVFEAMVNLFEVNEPIDTVTVYEELRKNGKADAVGGAVFLSQLSQDISSAANIIFHSKIILEKAILRNLISASHEVAQEAYQSSEDAFDILDNAQRRIFEITEQYMKSSYQDMDRAVRKALEYIEAIHSSDYKNFSVPTGFYDLDNILGGFQKSDLIILAARPSMGKTAFALSLTRNAAIQYRVPVAFFSLEMATIQLVIRLICSEGRLDAQKVRTGKLPSEDGMKLGKIASKLIEAPIYVDDAPAQTILEIRAKSRRLKAEKGIGLIVIDYLQLIQGPARSESREREISQISRSLKALAKELNVPIIALSQLNRAVETRTEKRPQLSDLRESGSIEQDADVVMFLNRPEYYGIGTDSNGNSTEGMAEVIIAKQRNGPVGEIQLSFIKEYGRFESREHFRQIEPGAATPVQIEEDFPI